MTEWDAAEYSRRSSLQEAMAQEVLALLDLDGSERILDVGCGDGKITAEIASRASKGAVVGVGIWGSLPASDTGIGSSRGRAKRLPRPTRFHQGSSVGFRFADGILRLLRSWLRGMDESFASGRTDGLHQRCSRSLPSSS